MCCRIIRLSTVRGCLIVAAFLGSHPGALRAQDVTLNHLLAEADSANPAVTAASRTAAAAAARVPQAGALPDPTVGIGAMNVPVSSPGLSGDMMTMAQLQVGARLPWPGKLSLREQAARLEAEASSLDAEQVRQQVRADVKAAYFDVYFLDRAAEITRRNAGLLTDFTHLTATRYAVGTGAQPDVLKAQVERAGLENQLVTLRDRRTAEAARLNALLGRAPDTPLPPPALPEGVRQAALERSPDAGYFTSAALSDALSGVTVTAEGDPAGDDGPLASPAELRRRALAHNPRILADALRLEADERGVSLARKATLPDVSVSAGYSRRAGRGDFFSVMVSAPVPVFSGRKQDQGVLEQAAVLAAREAGHQSLVDDVNARITSLSAELRRARAQIVILDEAILPQAETALSSATTSYQVGRVDFLTLLDAEVTLYRHQLAYHRLLADFAKSMAALERAVGTEVLR